MRRHPIPEHFHQTIFCNFGSNIGNQSEQTISQILKSSSVTTNCGSSFSNRSWITSNDGDKNPNVQRYRTRNTCGNAMSTSTANLMTSSTSFNFASILSTFQMLRSSRSAPTKTTLPSFSLTPLGERARVWGFFSHHFANLGKMIFSPFIS